MAVTAIDLFSGAGGFSLGALGAGADVVGALEIDPHAAASYRLNIRRKGGEPVPLIDADILRTTPKAALAKWGVQHCDIVLGGPPCQGFSSHRLLDSGVDDPRNKLIDRYFKYVNAIRPRVFLMENVPGLLWDRHADYLEAFLDAADDADYEIDKPIVLNARDYGVPQNRKRVFILGIDRDNSLDVAWPPRATHVSPQAHKDGDKRPAWLTAKSVFGRAPKADPNNIHMSHSPELVQLFRRTPRNGGSRRDAPRTLPCHADHDGHSDVYGRISLSRPGPTMTTACINPSKGRFVHPEQHHGITVRQAARFQTFPDTFVFTGGLMSAGQQIGNAVPVRLAEQLLRPLVRAIECERARSKPAQRA